jgi:hypothetical protein
LPTKCALAGSATYREYQAICGWLDESDGLAGLAEYRARSGADQVPAGDGSLRVLIGLAKEASGAP